MSISVEGNLVFTSEDYDEGFGAFADMTYYLMVGTVPAYAALGHNDYSQGTGVIHHKKETQPQ